MNRTLKIFYRFVIFILGTTFLSHPVFADEAVLMTQIQMLQKQMAEMQQMIRDQGHKIKDLEQKQASVAIPGPVAGETAAAASDKAFNEQLDHALGGAHKWLKDLKFSGDLRLRSEWLDFTSGSPAETDARNRFRFRLRYGFEKKFSDEMKIGFGMTSAEQSGGQNVDPTTTNISFDNLFNFKDIFIEKAYATYTPSWAKDKGPVKAVEITAGKFANPFEKGASLLVWDSDLRPEGIYEKIEFNLLDSESFDLKGYFTAGQYVLDEDATVGGDSEMFGYQLGFQETVQTPWLEKPIELLHAVSFYSYNDYAQVGNFTIGATSLARGNAVCGTAELCASDFEIWEYYNEISFSPRGIPIRPFLDIAHNPANSALGDEGFAYGLGLKIGKIKKKGDWEIGYDYRRVENESVVGAFSDSDFGLGGAGKRGSVLKLGYGLTDYLVLNSGISLVNNLTAGTAGVSDEEQRRFQLDLVWKF